LQSIIENEARKIKESFKGDNYFAVQNIVRRLDVFSSFSGGKKVTREVGELFNFGWSNAIRPFFAELNLQTSHPFVEITQQDIAWADSAILFAGKLAFCKQIIEYEKAGFLEIVSPTTSEFGFRYLNPSVGIEYFERASADFFRENIVKKIIEEKKAKTKYDEKSIHKQLKSIIRNPYGKYISYNTTNDIDEYYNQKGHYHMLLLQGYDNFNTKDTFGSIAYWKYVDLIELIIGVAHMHRDACIELVRRNRNVDMHNVLSYNWFKDKTVKTYSDYLDVPVEEIEQIISCLTLSSQNYEYYMDYPSVPPPIYFQTSNNQLIRSVAGCMGNPIRLLNSELKRKFTKDYDEAVNRREDRFRRELFMFFPDQRIVKIPREINISFDGIKTDIDAVVYDTTTRSLGLFQLKWQDPFAQSMQERRSRISNLFPKANEWIDKMRIWTQSFDVKTILNALQITKYAPNARAVDNIYVFVIARNHIHFTGVKTNETVAWGSWYQIIESQAMVKANFDDPIKEMFVKLKMYSPELRIEREELPIRLNVDLKFGEYRIFNYE